MVGKHSAWVSKILSASVRSSSASSWSCGARGKRGKNRQKGRLDLYPTADNIFLNFSKTKIFLFLASRCKALRRAARRKCQMVFGRWAA
jgi:hypothetical protein